MIELFLLSMLLGSFAGILAGLFGLGGGVVIVPALVWLFTVQQFPKDSIMIMAVATSLATIIPTSLSAILTHYKLGTILWDKVFRLSPGVLVGAGVGAVVADLVEAEILKLGFICYLLYISIQMALQSGSGKSLSEYKWLDYIAGHGIGFLSSLLGIGGGTLTVPYLAARATAMKNAVAVSSVCGFPIALSGTIAYALLGWGKDVLPEGSLGYVYLPAFSGIILCSVITAPLGAKLAVKLAAKKLKRYFSLVIFLIALKMMML